MATEQLAAFERFLERGAASGRALSASSITTYMKVAKLIVKAKKPEKILVAGLSVSTKTKYVSVLRHWAAFTKDAELAEMVSGGPQLQKLLKNRESKLPQKIEAFTDAEVDRFLEILKVVKGGEPPWVWPCVSLQLHLALRVSADLAGVRRDAVESALVTKKLALMGKRERIDFMPAGFVAEELQMLAELPSWEIVADLMSPTTRKLGEYAHRQKAYEMYVRAMQVLGPKAGIVATKTHRFRHWGITNFIKKVAKGDIKRAQRFARHASIETTLLYYRTVDLEEDDAALAELKGRQ